MHLTRGHFITSKLTSRVGEINKGVKGGKHTDQALRHNNLIYLWKM